MKVLVEYELEVSHFSDFLGPSYTKEINYHVADSLEDAAAFIARSEIEHSSGFKLIAVYNTVRFNMLGPNNIKNILNDVRSTELTQYHLVGLLSFKLKRRSSNMSNVSSIRDKLRNMGTDMSEEAKGNYKDRLNELNAEIQANEDEVAKHYNSSLNSYWRDKLDEEFNGIPERLAEKMAKEKV